MLRTQYLYWLEVENLANKFIDEYYENPEYYGDYEDRENQPNFYYDGVDAIFNDNHEFFSQEPDLFYVLAYSRNKTAIQDFGIDAFYKPFCKDNNFLEVIKSAAFIAMREDVLERIEEKLG